jgi:hypothetical protein
VATDASIAPETDVSARASCVFCGAGFDSLVALRIARAGGRMFCDAVCHFASDTRLDDKVVLELVEKLRSLEPLDG